MRLICYFFEDLSSLMIHYFIHQLNQIRSLVSFLVCFCKMLDHIINEFLEPLSVGNALVSVAAQTAFLVNLLLFCVSSVMQEI
jgi:hypothetical protein